MSGSGAAPDRPAIDPSLLEGDDPFEAFSVANGAGTVTNPYPDFAAARALAPVHGAGGVAGGEGAEGPAAGLFTAYSFEAVQQVFRDGATFSSSAYGQLMGPVFGRSILEMDEPEHHTYRALIQQAFTRRAMQGWEARIIRPVIEELVGAIARRGGPAELVRELTFPFPIRVIGGMLGLPREDLELFHRLAVQVIAVNIDLDRALRASAALRAYLQPLLDERRRRPADDLISLLAEAELDGQRLTDDEIMAFLRLLLPAGAETTYRSSSNLLTGLLTHPDQLDAVRADAALLPQAIEEGLRWECPLLIVLRTAVRDTEVAGVPIGAGSAVITNMGSANHDETRWDDPERFDIHRPARSHLAFAAGPHTCLGMHLARMETTVLLETLFDRLPGLRADPDRDPPVVTGLTFRSPAELPVVFG